MKKVLSYILISFVIFANLFAPIGVALSKENISISKNIAIAATATQIGLNSTTQTSVAVNGVYNSSDKIDAVKVWYYVGTKADNLLPVSNKDSNTITTDTTGDNPVYGYWFGETLSKYNNGDKSINNYVDFVKGNTYFVKTRISKTLADGTQTFIVGADSEVLSFVSGTPSQTGFAVTEAGKTAAQTAYDQAIASGKTAEEAQVISISKQYDKKTDTTPAKKMPACGLGSPMGCIAQGFYYVLFVPTSYLFALAGTFFDYTFSYSVQDSSYRSSFVVQGWGLVRDFCNIFFIFVMLYIAIGTILSLHGFKTKETIINVVIIGLFINFSLFAAQVIIDASNITARVFYNSDAIKITQGGANGVTEATPLLKVGDGGIIPLSAAIVNKVNPQNMILHSGKITQIPDSGGASSTDENPANMDASTFILIVVMASAVNIVGLSVFFTVGFLFVARVIGLWLAMIMAPLAFFTYILPQLEGVKMVGWKNWWPETLKLAFLAPVFIFFMYLILKFLSMDLISDAMSKSMSTDGLAYFAATLIPFAFIMILLLKAKNIATGMSGEFGEMATKFGSSLGGMVLGGAVGAGAVAMRGTVGRLGNYVANNNKIQSAAAQKGIIGFGARTLFSGGKKASTASFDARNTKLGGMATKELKVDMGKAKQGGFAKLRSDKAAEREKRAKDLELTVDSTQRKELMKKKVALKKMENDSSHSMHEIDGKLTAAKDRKLYARAGSDEELEAINEIKDLTRQKSEINNGGVKKDGTYNTDNGKISKRYVESKEKAENEAKNNVIKADNNFAQAKAAISFDPDVIAAANKKAKADNDLVLANNALAINPMDINLSIAAKNAKLAVSSAETEHKNATLKANSKLTEFEEKLKTAKEGLVKASEEAAEALAAAANGYGTSINDLKIHDIPDEEFEINQRNNAMRNDYANLVGSNFNKALNFLSSGGQHSFDGDHEAEYNIRMAIKTESGGGGHGGGGDSHAAPAAHATPAAKPTTSPTTASSGGGSPGHGGGH